MKYPYFIVLSVLFAFGCSNSDSESEMEGPDADIPSVTTIAVTNITTNSATSGGNVTSDGGASIIQRGVCWSIAENPTIADNRTVDGNVTGSFTSEITVLESGTTYFVRAYASNMAGIGYGSQVSFTTQ